MKYMSRFDYCSTSLFLFITLLLAYLHSTRKRYVFILHSPSAILQALATSPHTFLLFTLVIMRTQCSPLCAFVVFFLLCLLPNSRACLVCAEEPGGSLCRFSTVLKSQANRYFAVAPQRFDAPFVQDFSTDMLSVLRSTDPSVVSPTPLVPPVVQFCECGSNTTGGAVDLTSVSLSVEKVEKVFLKQKTYLGVEFIVDDAANCTASAPFTKDEYFSASPRSFVELQNQFYYSLTKRRAHTRLNQKVYVFPGLSLDDISHIVSNHGLDIDSDDDDYDDDHDDMNNLNAHRAARGLSTPVSTKYGARVVEIIARTYTFPRKRSTCSTATCVLGVVCAIAAVFLVLGALFGCCLSACAARSRERQDEKRLVRKKALIHSV